MFIPKVGELIKLKEWGHYQQLMHVDPEMVMWAWLEVISIDESGVVVVHSNAGKRVGPYHHIPLDMFKAPWGWEDVYTITAMSEDVAKRAVEWFSRGIAVWINHNMSTQECGTKAFTPLHDDGVVSPHWQYTSNPLEIVRPEDCARRFRVVWIETESVVLPSTKQCSARRGAVQQLRKEHPGTMIKVEGEYATWDIEHVVHEPPQDSL